jgi:hypothetical protein
VLSTVESRTTLDGSVLEGNKPNADDLPPLIWNDPVKSARW